MYNSALAPGLRKVQFVKQENLKTSAWFRPEIIVQISATLLVYQLLWLVQQTLGRLPESSYSQPWISAEVIRNIFSGDVVRQVPGRSIGALGFFAVTFAIFAGTAFKYRQIIRPLPLSWRQASKSKSLKRLIMLPVVLITWLSVTYQFNLYYEQGHYFDRVLLVVFAALVYWRPLFLVPFLVLVTAIYSQFLHPFPANPGWYEPSVLIRALTLFTATIVLPIGTRKESNNTFFFLLVCLLAASYWKSGTGKFFWLSHPHLNLLTLGAYANQWLGFLHPATIVAIVKAIGIASIPMMAFAFCLELGSISVGWSKRWLCMFLVGFISFHIGVFATTGMFFWKWILFEVAFLFVLKSDKKNHWCFFSRCHFIVSVLLILTCSLWANPRNLSWYDTPLTYRCEIDAIGESGNHYRLKTSCFEPYRDYFTLRPIEHLSEHPQLTSIWGITSNRKLAGEIVGLTNLAEVEALENESGTVFANENNAEKFDRFVTRFFGAHNRIGKMDSIWSHLKTPPHLWTIDNPDRHSDLPEEQIQRIEVIQKTYLFDGEEFACIRTREIHSVDIPLSTRQ